MNEALTINEDGAQRNPDIHWPKGQHPEDADLYAHNESMVNASCETEFANIVDAQSWPRCRLYATCRRQDPSESGGSGMRAISCLPRGCRVYPPPCAPQLA
jgi:hypothetical protein